MVKLSSGGSLGNTIQTAEVDDNAITLAKQAHGTQGGIQYYGATGTPTELATGTVGQHLVAGGAGANPSWADLGAGSAITFQGPMASVIQGTWALARDESVFTDALWYNSTSADGDELNYTEYFAAGTYTVQLYGQKSADSGIVDIHVGGSEVASFDMNGAGNVVLSTASIAITAGVKTLRIVLDGKTGTSFISYINRIRFFRTA